MRLSLLLLLAGYFAAVVVAWGKEDHEIFRLRDEVVASEGPEVTFYDFLGVKPQAGHDEIIKAFRKKSKLLHPDKAKQQFVANNSKPAKSKPKPGEKKKPGVHVAKPPSESEVRNAVKQASDRYARLGVVAQVLRGEQRERYDYFLKHGFPRWRGTGYYYERFRPGLGSVLAGLFLFGGGAMHYGALYLGWKRQREFVGRYVRHARRAAWGDEVGIKGIPGIDGSLSAPSKPTEEELAMQGLNRKQRRLQERGGKRGKAANSSSGGGGGGAGAAANGDAKVVESGPRGERKKVVAENGKVLIVDATGDVYLEEQNEDGETEAYLLDVDEIPLPTIQQTVLFRAPVWIYHQTVGRALGSARKTNPDAAAEIVDADSGTEEDDGTDKSRSPTPGVLTASGRRRGKNNGKAR